MKNIVAESHHVMTNMENNNNKFWRIFRYDDHSCRVEFGRVGDSGQSKDHSFRSESEATSFFESKMREKLKKGYLKIEVITSTVTKTISPKGTLSEVATKQISTTSSEVTKLIQYFAQVNIHNIVESTTMQYDVDSGLFKTPVGIVTLDSIVVARKLLTDMSKFILSKDLKNSSYIKLLEEYLMRIPQNVGRKLNPETIYVSNDDIIKQNDILDSLEASFNSTIANPVKNTSEEVVEEKKLFNVELELITDKDLLKRLHDKFKNSSNSVHVSNQYSLKKAYTVKIDSMYNEYVSKGEPLGNVKELWHGTKASNILSILKSGLVIPRSSDPHVCGRMFGDGLYFSDQSTKSLNYACGYWDGKRDNNPFMFIADVAMGKEFIPSGSGRDFPKPGYDSTFAKAGKSGVANNEMIVYKLNQCNLKYLCEFGK